MNPSIRRWAVALSLSSLAASALAGPVLDRIQKTGKLVIGHRQSSVPFSYVVAGQPAPVGYAIDLCLEISKAIAKHVKRPSLNIGYLQVDGGSRFPAVLEGRVDLGCETATNTTERRQQVAFTIPHYITGARIVVRADSPINELRDFRGKKIVSTTGTTPLKALRQANETSDIRTTIGEVPEHKAGFDAVESGQADGFVMDEAVLQGMILARPDPTKFKIVGRYLTVEPLSIMFSKDDPELKQLVDAEMRRLIFNGEAKKLHDRWFLQPIPPDSKVLGLRMPHLLRDFWKYPSDWVVN